MATLSSFENRGGGAISVGPDSEDFRRRCFGFWMEASSGFRIMARRCGSWTIRLDLLDEAELTSAGDVFLSAGRAGGDALRLQIRGMARFMRIAALSG